MKKISITYNAPTVLSFVLICVAVLILGNFTGGQTTRLLFMTYHSSLMDPLTYVRFVTHVFGHGDWNHLLGNATYLLLLGPMLEEKYGSRTLWIVVGITALATGLVNYIFFPNVALCGASGVVFAFIIMASFTGFRNNEIPLTFILVAIIFIGQQVIDGLFVTDNISNMAHIVGGAVGSVLGYVWNRKPGGSRR
ncbi:MAG: rhomboid family intramembrane serine protease [Lachnospiraceae bacterium]|nr:rhomboid family intramembrane serine protease [Lachnospiraceae bacterium]